MCVPSEKIRDEVVFCSNCGSEKIATKWVYKYKKIEPKKVSIDEKIQAKMSPPSFLGSYSTCGDCSLTSIPVQLVLSCEACNYTVTKPYEAKK